MKLTKSKAIMTGSAVLVLAVIACLPKKQMQLPPQEETVYTVKTQAAEKKDIQEYLRLNGTVKAENTISVYPDIGGKLIRVPVTLGSYVKKGALIAEVDPSSPGTHYTSSPVYAPISGYITSLPLTTGTTVSTTTQIATIGNINTLQVECRVPESKIAVLKTGLTAQIGLEAYKGETFPARVAKISPVVDEVSRTKEMYLLFDTSDERINAGMYVKIHLNTVLHKDCIAVPSDSVLTENSKSYIYVYNEDGTVSKREIECGVTVDGQTEILSGISEGESVVVSGMQVLSDGVKVRTLGGEE